MNPTRASIALDYVRRSAEVIRAEQISLARFRELAAAYGCSPDDVAKAELGHAERATPELDGI